MAPAAFAQLSDEELFDKVLRGRVEREEDRAALGELCERWRKPACFVIRQYRGVSEQLPGKSASPKTFFLRIVKHVAIDHYRRRREELASPPDSEDAPETSVHEAQVSMAEARRSAERADATELYWAAFKRLQVEHPNEAAAWDLYHHQAVEDHEQCARQLMITVANSYKRVSRAQAYMKVYLLELMDEGGTS
jgi:RNA polymerase sigma-70 factor (ECF subfamily)